MVRISRAAEYALVALKHMAAAPDNLSSARELSLRYSLPAGRVAKVLQKLAAAQIVVSEQGAHGGYRLAEPVERVSFLRLSEAVDGPLRFAACERNPEGQCDREATCTVAGPVHQLGEQITALLSAVTVGEVLSAGLNLQVRDSIVAPQAAPGGDDAGSADTDGATDIRNTASREDTREQH